MVLDNDTLYAAMPVGSGLSPLSGPARLENGQLGIDTSESDVHRGFIIDFNNSAKESAQRAIEVKTEQEIVAKKKEASDDDLDMVVDEARDTMRELQQERMEQIINYGGYEFDLDAYQDATRENMDNWEEFSKDMTQAEKDEYWELSVLLLDTDDPEEAKRIIARQAELRPEETLGTAKRANNLTIEEKQAENEAELVASDETLAFADEMFGELPPLKEAAAPDLSTPEAGAPIFEAPSPI